MLLRKFSIIALVAIAVGGFNGLTASDANAQASDTQSANINALINNPIVLANTGALDFGSAAPSAAPTTVIISAAGANSGTAIGRTGGAAAGFTVEGLSNQAYTVTLPANGTVVLTGPGTDMAVNDFTHNATGTISAGGGPDAFGVGATLNIGADQTAGAYTGSFDVTVDYN